MRRVLVDADAFTALAGMGRAELLRGVDGRIEIPAIVQVEIGGGPAAGALERATSPGGRWVRTPRDPPAGSVERAAAHLGREVASGSFHGDVELLAPALGSDDSVIVTDDGLLRRACNALNVPSCGSISIVIGAVERRDLGPAEAGDALLAMDEVGPRLSARLFRRAERLIDAAADRREA